MSSTMPRGRDGVMCPYCKIPMVLRRTKKYTYPNGDPRLFYGCPAWPQCDAVHGAHPNGEPLGVPADERTKRARIKAHSAFDALWKRKDMRRNDAYEWLAGRLGLKRDDCHVGMFDFDMCQKVIEICSEVESETRDGDSIVRMPPVGSSPTLRHTSLADALRSAQGKRADGDRDSRLGLSRPS